jgi:hypothetical protein
MLASRVHFNQELSTRNDSIHFWPVHPLNCKSTFHFLFCNPMNNVMRNILHRPVLSKNLLINTFAFSDCSFLFLFHFYLSSQFVLNYFFLFLEYFYIFIIKSFFYNKLLVFIFISCFNFNLFYE